MTKRKTSTSSNKSVRSEPVSLADLVELVMEPIAAQIDRSRLEMHERTQGLHSEMEKATAGILEKIQAIEDSVEILALQKARDLQEKSGGKR